MVYQYKPLNLFRLPTLLLNINSIISINISINSREAVANMVGKEEETKVDHDMIIQQ
jgi:hypothetical protein